VQEELTKRQRRVFLTIVVNGVPLDALVVQMGFEPQRDLQDDVRRAA
jgi:hypothetical protein